MAEPLSVAGLAISVVDLACKLHSYISSARGAKDDIRRLSVELLALKGALDLFDTLKASAPNISEMLALTQETLQSIGKHVKEPSSAVGRAVRSMTWPFKSAEVANYVAALERSKTFFTMVIMSDAHDFTTAVYSDLKNLTAVVHEDIVARRTDRIVAETEGLLRWLAPFNCAEEQVKASRGRVPGTGSWFVDEQFEAWYDVTSKARPVLWITGKSGSGKTTLVSSLVDEVERRCVEKPGTAVSAYHYCSLDSIESQTAPNVLGSLLAQMVRAHPPLADRVRKLQRPGTLAISELEALLASASEAFEQVYLFVDALNETTDQSDIISTLVDVCYSCRHVRVLVTCTTDPSEKSSAVRQRRMGTDAVDRDIERYVDHRLATEKSFRLLSPAMQIEILTAVTAGANGTFRWAQLCVDRLSSLRTGRDIRAALNDMPSTLNETYANILKRVAPADTGLVREVLRWLCFSTKPLTILELAEAVILDEADHHLDDDCRLNNPGLVLEICAGLIEVDGGGFVTLSHDSIRSFLTTDWIRSSQVASYALDPRASQKAMMRKCLAYIGFDEFAQGHVDSHALLARRFRNWPLLEYAAIFWPYHARMCRLDASDEKLILDMFATKKTQKNGGVFESWVQFLINSADVESIRETEPLYYAASYNMVPVLKLLLRPGSGVQVDQPGGRFGATPLAIACYRRHTEAAKLLLDAGADPTIFDEGIDMTVIDLARNRRMDDIVGLMEQLSTKRRVRGELGEGHGGPTPPTGTIPNATNA